MDQIQHKFIQVDDGVKLHVAEIGSGPSVVLFLHGFPEIWYSWRHQMIAVAKAGYRAIAPDYRGYGLSDPPPEPHPLSLAHLCKRRPAAEFCSNQNNFFFPIFPLLLLPFSCRQMKQQQDYYYYFFVVFLVPLSSPSPAILLLPWCDLVTWSRDQISQRGRVVGEEWGRGRGRK